MKAGRALKTARTAVCFYLYDRVFDGIDGLWEAIDRNDLSRLEDYKNRFKDVTQVIGLITPY